MLIFYLNHYLINDICFFYGPLCMSLHDVVADDAFRKPLEKLSDPSGNCFSTITQIIRILQTQILIDEDDLDAAFGV